MSSSKIVLPAGFAFPEQLKLKFSVGGVRYRLKSQVVEIHQGGFSWNRWSGRRLSFKVSGLKVAVEIAEALNFDWCEAKVIKVNGYTWHYDHGKWEIWGANGIPETGLPKEVAKVVNSALATISPYLQQVCEAEALAHQQRDQRKLQQVARAEDQNRRHFNQVLEQLR